MGSRPPEKTPSRAGRARLASWLVAACLASALAGAAGRAEAAGCSASNVSGVAFGTYDVFSASPLDSLGGFTWRCTGSQHSVRITLTRGGSPTFQPRRLTSAASQLAYNLYLDAARTAVWGDGTEGTQEYFGTSSGSSDTVTVSIYGRVPAGQDAAVGTYTDTITVVLNF